MPEIRNYRPAGEPCKVAHGSYGGRARDKGKECTTLQEAAWLNLQ
jgi:hypothetical protein